MKITWRFLLMVASVVLALVLTGCPKEVEEVVKGDDGGIERNGELPAFTHPKPGDMGWEWVPIVVPALNDIPEMTVNRWEELYGIWDPIRRWAIKPGVEYVFKTDPYGHNGAGTQADGEIWATYDAYVSADGGMRGGGGRDKPVCGVDLRAAIVFCNALSEAEGKQPVYRNADGKILIDATKEVEKYVDAAQMAGKNGYRLLTKEEWLRASERKANGTLKTGINGGTTAYTGSDDDGKDHGNAVQTTTTIGWMDGGAWEWTYNAADHSYALMGGDIFHSAAVHKWEPRANTPPDFEGGKTTDAVGFRIRLN